MTQKTTAFILILVANIILLAHAVVPHHHHQSITCITKTHCHNNPQAEHGHDGAGNANFCLLKQAVIIPTSVIKFFKSYDNCPKNHDQEYYFLINCIYKVVSPHPTAETFAPGLTFQFITFINSSQGLRAPPKA